MVDLAFDHADVDFEVENLCGDGGAVGDVDVDLGFWVFVEVSCEIGDGEVVADGEAGANFEVADVGVALHGLIKFVGMAD